MNTFIVLAIFCNLLNLLYYGTDGMTKSAVIEASGIVLLLFFMLCNMRGFVEIPKLLSILFVNCHSFALCYIEGTVQGAYLYLFPFVMAMIFFLRVRKNDLAVTLFIIATTTNLLGIVLLLPYHAHFEIVPDAIAYRHLVMNIIINFLLVVVFFYFVLRLLDAKEKKNVSEKKFADTILNTSLDAVFVVNPAVMEIKQYNDKAAELFELNAFDKKSPAYSVAGVLGERIADRIGGISAESVASKGSIGQDRPGNWQNDNVFERGSGSSFHGFVSIVSFEYSGQQFIKISILDMTSLKLAEFEALQAREKAEKAAAAKTRFMSNMSHELRTPLNAIIGTAYLLIEDEELMQHNDHFRILKNSSEHMLQLVNEVLDFSKLDEGKLEFIREPFDLNDTLRQATDSLATICNQKGVKLISDIALLPEAEHAVGDEMRLKQVILNLVSNAVKFTETGSVTLQTQIKKQVKAYREIYFAVIDTGIGIAPDKLHLIFDSFTQADAETTRRYGGSGLGLSIAKALVKKMGGDLEVASEVGRGSCFYFTLKIPFRQADPTAPLTEKVKGLKQLAGIRILLAEDNALNQKIAKRFLRNWGATIHTADNGIIAWELFQQQSFDLLLIDLEMPLMDGKQLLAAIRRIDKEIPAIAFTAAIYDDMYKDIRMSGFNGYLHKPFRPDEMQRTILQFLDH
jgi:CheY-like chemotaxis protein/nitrogen-specific signal transduction histidine kinase